MAAATLLNKIFQGEVAAVHNYGAFARIPGEGRLQGLIHKSQISASRVDDATEVLEKNEKVWFKVISVSPENKIGLSMKVVDQGSGRDLDPNGVQMSLDVQQRKERVGRGESSAITLEAVLKTTCSKCGITGHLSSTCFQAPGGKVYELLEEPEPEKKIFGTVEDRLRRLADAGLENDTVVSEHKARKKSKKAAVKKELSSSSNDSDSSSSESSIEKEKRRKEKSKRKHKSKYSESEFDDEKRKKKKRRKSSNYDKVIKHKRKSKKSESESDSDYERRKKKKKNRKK